MGNQACCACEKEEDLTISEWRHEQLGFYDHDSIIKTRTPRDLGNIMEVKKEHAAAARADPPPETVQVNSDMDEHLRVATPRDLGNIMEVKEEHAAAARADTPPETVQVKREVGPPSCNDKAYIVKLEKQGGVKLGMDLEVRDGLAILPLLGVTGGLAEQWNEANPHVMMEKGDSIVEVNGCRDNAQKMLDCLKRDQVLELTLRTQLTKDHLVADIEKLVDAMNCGPLLIRLCWHDPRYSSSEADVAGSPLANISAKYCPAVISNADLRMLAANVSIRLMGGPDIPVHFGRVDAAPSAKTVPSQEHQDEGADHLLWILSAKGFSVKDRVAISGSKCVGSCHADRSGFEGERSMRPLRFDNSHFKNLLSKKYGSEILESDVALTRDPKLKKLVEKYAADQDLFFKDFAKSWVLLQELTRDGAGPPVRKGAPRCSRIPFCF